MFYVSHLFGDVLRLSYEINNADSVSVKLHFAGDAGIYTGSSVSGDGVPAINLEVNIER